LDLKVVTLALPLDGVGYTSVDGLLRSLLTPNAAIESGYRQFRVETVNNQIYVGFLVSRDDDMIVLRRPDMEDLRIRQTEIVRAEFTRTSMMPEGLLEALSPEEVTDLFTYMRTLR
jgi:putative heme-binding domain-containing protein